MADKGGFDQAEREAMKQRAAELRASKGLKGAAKREREAQACAEAIAAMTGTDQQTGRLLDDLVTEIAPDLDPKTMYGFPAYARDGKVIVFFQPASRWEMRYGMVAFQQDAKLDDGPIWPTSYAVVEVNAEVEKKLRELITRAVAS
ncbi:MAG: hypothetical protein VB080_10765 [Propionicimonas sp.]|uniref:hypothetical protein n=1 Tax=Propionicimonas sp. TaxID=1955623 RepID=UPI002B21A673|nr:hypothetical protein [Propionicimonas sp.]MEA4944899.1 hypothetical protein [Propionicimonas sp.]MEA5055419.1 hypothetical protein [Propionicimonas sp.]MEA5118470.1 hypothetical protein [Propionicimonas sp.]